MKQWRMWCEVRENGAGGSILATFAEKELLPGEFLEEKAMNFAKRQGAEGKNVIVLFCTESNDFRTHQVIYPTVRPVYIERD